MKKGNRFVFTKAKLTSLQSRETNYYVYDEKISGLCLLVTPKGAKTFYVYKKLNGTPKRIKIGRFPYASIENARKSGGRIIVEMQEGKDPSKVRQQEKNDKLTISMVFHRYLHEYSMPRKKTWSQDLSQFNRYLADWKDRRLRSISKGDIERKIADLPDIAGNRLLSLLSTLFNWVIDRGLTKENPAQGIKRAPEKMRDRALSISELRRFIAAAKEDNPLVGDYFLMSIFTGARRSNVLSMRWDEIDIECAVWRIPQEKIKRGERTLEVPLPPPAIQVLKGRPRTASPFVFPSTGKSGHLVEPKRGLRRILKRAEITTHTRIHDLRHTFASLLANEGANAFVIKAAMGHKDFKTTSRYVTPSLKAKRSAVEAAFQEIDLDVLRA